MFRLVQFTGPLAFVSWIAHHMHVAGSTGTGTRLNMLVETIELTRDVNMSGDRTTLRIGVNP